MTAKAGSTLLLGAARAELTPDKDVILGGATMNGKIRTGRIKDPLYASAAILENKDCRLCIITLDLLMITRKYVNLIREELQARWGLDPQSVLIHATQNHKGPALGHFKIEEEYQGIPQHLSWLRGGDDRYDDYAVKQILLAVEEAMARRVPVEVGAGSGIQGNMAFNRRMVMRDGSIRMPGFDDPPGIVEPESRYLEGPMDPELGVVCFRDTDSVMQAMLLSYTCHPVHEIRHPYISADWPGAWASEMRNSGGGACIPVVLNGACGNINPWDPYAETKADDAGLMGETLARTTREVIGRMSFAPDTILDYRIRTIPIPLRQLEPEQVEQAQQYIAKYPEPEWVDDTFVDLEWVFASALLSQQEQYERNPEFQYEIQVLRIGDTAIVGLPGEPFAEGGLAIKMQSPTFPTYIVHNTQYAGYIPTEAGFHRGGYESRIARMEPKALDRIVAASVEMLGEMFS
ncbi:hypothetical protein [Paenibacillus sp. MBLB4367]|uniref:hypothetical protein n=1 Tax=Paenibacillus sp. MBLB4367 TaxID=3384767 RepID=UPI003907EBA4